MKILGRFGCDATKNGLDEKKDESVLGRCSKGETILE